MQISFIEVVNAYYICRRNKRSDLSAIEFEFNLEKNLYELYIDLKVGAYQIMPHTVFIIEKPKPREIWAAQFRDRIVHHVLYNRLAPLFLPSFIESSYACIPKRGSLKASSDLKKGIRAFGGIHSSGYYLKADIANYFVSIDKNILWKILEKKIHDNVTKNYTKQIVFHDLLFNPSVKFKKNQASLLPRHKSLFNAPLDKGLPIGNLTSQFFANVYLNELDQFVIKILGFSTSSYFRYVDDFILLSDNKIELQQALHKINFFLRDCLKLKLHPNKVSIGKLEKGIDFVGYFHRYDQRFLRKNVVNKIFFRICEQVNHPSQNPIKFRQAINSYLGRLKHCKSYQLRKKLYNKIASDLRSTQGKWVTNKNYLKIKIR